MSFNTITLCSLKKKNTSHQKNSLFELKREKQTTNKEKQNRSKPIKSHGGIWIKIRRQ